jgi:hypothetical protein
MFQVMISCLRYLTSIGRMGLFKYFIFSRFNTIKQKYKTTAKNEANQNRLEIKSMHVPKTINSKISVFRPNAVIGWESIKTLGMIKKCETATANVQKA